MYEEVNLTLIESNKLEQLLEKAIEYDIMIEANHKDNINYYELAKERARRKANFLKDYVTIPLDDLIDEEGLKC